MALTVLQGLQEHRDTKITQLQHKVRQIVIIIIIFYT